MSKKLRNVCKSLLMKIEGNISISKPLKKTKLPTFNANVKFFKTDTGGKKIRFR